MGGMMLIVGILTIVAMIWALARFLQYQFGEYRNYIHVPSLTWALLIVGIWTPFLNYIVIAYLLFGCKSVRTLMRAREQAIKTLTPKDVIDAAEQLIQDNNLVGDVWVVGTWNKEKKSDWIIRLSSKPMILRETLLKKLKIHASKVEPCAEWVDVIKHFIYLEEQKQLSANT